MTSLLDRGKLAGSKVLIFLHDFLGRTQHHVRLFSVVNFLSFIPLLPTISDTAHSILEISIPGYNVM